MDLEQYVKKADLAEKEIEDLAKTIKALLAEKPKAENQEIPEELEKLRIENTKLKYRLGILQRATAEIQSKKTTVWYFYFLIIIFLLFYCYNLTI